MVSNTIATGINGSGSEFVGVDLSVQRFGSRCKICSTFIARSS